MKHNLDTKGLLCPMPVIKLQNYIKNTSPGDTIELTASDPGTKHDIPTWCRISGHQVIEQTEAHGLFHFLIAVR